MLCVKFDWNRPIGSEEVDDIKRLQTEEQMDAGQKGIKILNLSI